ncbi:MAG: UDP-N-acetylmuramoyl-L-alanyl-D-glutamate--2,6-diaminopimelate ligase [Chlorobiaceae bacterium]|nr:UDP-N-acetylmuramoyl-L-alanyl-D-glutamate--2,6-diaminopimelate ligase [Chlorobiaceae bacterium]
MVSLREIESGIGGILGCRGQADPASVGISLVSCDSREVLPGALFVAVRGFKTDGHRHIGAAVAAGAAAVVCEEYPGECPPTVRFILVGDARTALADAARVFHADAAGRLMLIGVTGTNGKTTTSRLITSMLNAAGIPSGYIGTGLCRIGGEDILLDRTTPESHELQALFRRMLDAGCKAAVMEVSSHALVLKRVHGMRFRAAVFTNLSPEHLDFHETMEGYAEAKRLLFGQLAPDGFGVVNADDPHAVYMTAGLAPDRVFRCSLEGGAAGAMDGRRVEAEISAMNVEGTRATIVFGEGRLPVTVALPGAFNVMNLLEAFAVGVGLGLDPAAALQGLVSADAVEGRMERFWSPDRSRCAVVDYAHTPDALQKALEALRTIVPAGAGLTVVFGCGGNRDRLKRPEMGRIAADLADRVILTSDNPRDEDPEAILDEIEAGMAGRAHLRVSDRAEAIRRAVEGLGDGDILLVAGKGHEKYQEVAGKKHYFSDQEILSTCLGKPGPGNEAKEHA